MGLKPPEPAAAPVDPVEAARARLLAANQAKPPHASNASPFLGGGDDHKKDAKAKAAARHAESERQKAQNLWATQQEKSLNAQAKQWGDINSEVQGIAGRLEQFDDTTNAARVHARMLRDEVAGIPQPIRQAVEALAAAADKLEQLKTQKKGIEESNNRTLSAVADRRSQHQRLFEGQCRPSKRPTTSAHASPMRKWPRPRPRTPFHPVLKAKRTPCAAKQPKLPSCRNSGGDATDRIGLASQITADINAVHQHLPKFEQTCASAVSQVYERMGIELKSQNNNSAAALVSFARRYWQQVPAALAPPGALLAEHSRTANSKWHVSLSTGGLNRAGSNDRRPQFGRDGKQCHCLCAARPRRRWWIGRRQR